MPKDVRKLLEQLAAVGESNGLPVQDWRGYNALPKGEPRHRVKVAIRERAQIALGPARQRREAEEAQRRFEQEQARREAERQRYQPTVSRWSGWGW